MDAGFSVHPGIFEPAAMIGVRSALDGAGLVRTRAGARHVLRVPAVRGLALAPCLLAIARGYLGDRAFPFRATLFDKSPASNWLVTWHQDTALPVQHQLRAAGWGPWSTKAGVLHAIAPASALRRIVALRVHLDDSGSDNGPLRVLPGSHALGVLDRPQIENLAATIRPVECLVPAGGVVAIRPLTVHASSKARNDQPRRVIHIEFASTARFDEGVELLVPER